MTRRIGIGIVALAFGMATAAQMRLTAGDAVNASAMMLVAGFMLGTGLFSAMQPPDTPCT